MLTLMNNSGGAGLCKITDLGLLVTTGSAFQAPAEKKLGELPLFLPRIGPRERVTPT